MDILDCFMLLLARHLEKPLRTWNRLWIYQLYHSESVKRSVYCLHVFPGIMTIGLLTHMICVIDILIPEQN